MDYFVILAKSNNHNDVDKIIDRSKLLNDGEGFLFGVSTYRTIIIQSNLSAQIIKDKLLIDLRLDPIQLVVLKVSFKELAGWVNNNTAKILKDTFSNFEG